MTLTGIIGKMAFTKGNRQENVMRITVIPGGPGDEKSEAELLTYALDKLDSLEKHAQALLEDLGYMGGTDGWQAMLLSQEDALERILGQPAKKINDRERKRRNRAAEIINAVYFIKRVKAVAESGSVGGAIYHTIIAIFSLLRPEVEIGNKSRNSGKMASEFRASKLERNERWARRDAELSHISSAKRRAEIIAKEDAENGNPIGWESIAKVLRKKLGKQG